MQGHAPSGRGDVRPSAAPPAAARCNLRPDAWREQAALMPASVRPAGSPSVGERLRALILPVLAALAVIAWQYLAWKSF